MAEKCRDWLKSLWGASYKGVPFFFESDEEDGGRGLVIHTFPNRDDPFVEDLGEDPRFYSGSAYVHGDDADRQAAAFTAMLVTRGAGTLMVPISGAVSVHLQTFKRRHQKDRLGLVAFEVKFVREGFATALVSLPFLANQAFSAAALVATKIAQALAQSLQLTGQADHAVTAAANGLANAAATLDVVRLSRPVEPMESARLRDVIQGIVDDAPVVVTPLALVANVEALAVTLVEATRDLADALPAGSAAVAMLDVVDAFAETPAQNYLSPSEQVAGENTAAVARLARMAALTAFAEAALRRTYVSRSEGVTARATISERFDLELEAAPGADNAELYVAIQDLRGRVAEYLSRLINDLAPVITVQAARQMPSLYWGYRLYQDPSRGAEIVGRNSVRHPSFVPATFQALAR